MPVKKVGSVFALFLFFTGLAGAVPAGFNIQGRLTDMNGVNRDGTYQMTFSVFPVETEGTALWEQDFSLSVKNGNFQVILQGLDKNNKLLEDKVKNLERAYVEITVSGEAPHGSAPAASPLAIRLFGQNGRRCNVLCRQYLPQWLVEG